MEMMYAMGIEIHFYATALLLVIILFNLMRILRATDIHVYAKKSVYINNLAALFLTAVIFTGMIMMAAKHLDFTIENIVMIVFSVVFIYLEVKRLKQLKYLDIKQENPLENYRSVAKTYIYIELVGTLLIAIWMLVL